MNALPWPTILTVGKILLAFVPLTFIPLLITLERRGASLMQDRVGPNRAAIPGVGLRLFGLVHNVSDGIKLFTKELVMPAQAHRFWYVLAPMIPLAVAFLSPAVIPWFGPMAFQTAHGIVPVTGQILEADTGILVLFALSGLSVYGVVLGSWASNSKYPLLGGMRASSMMISYEVSMGLSALGMFLIVGSFGLTEIVEWQGAHAWGVVVQPVGFVLFLASQFAETGRAPFDVAEGDSEIVAGYFTEYSAMRFGFYYMGEYAHVAIASALCATLFFGGYNLPFLDTEGLRTHLGPAAGVVLAAIALALAGLAAITWRFRGVVSRGSNADRALRVRELGIYGVGFSALALFSVLASIAAFAFVRTGVPALVDGLPVWPGWVYAGGALLQFGTLFAKTLFFCWVFIWVRWTLPRFRYDQIMHLGWKILLNVAIVNLLITAVVVQLLGD